MIGSNCPEDSQRRNGGRRHVFRESIFFCRQRGSLGMEFHPPWTHVAGDDKLLSKPLVNGSRDGRRRTLVFIESESDTDQHGNGGHYHHDRFRMVIGSVLFRQDSRPRKPHPLASRWRDGFPVVLGVRRVRSSDHRAFNGSSQPLGTPRAITHSPSAVPSPLQQALVCGHFRDRELGHLLEQLGHARSCHACHCRAQSRLSRRGVVARPAGAVLERSLVAPLPGGLVSRSCSSR